MADKVLDFKLPKRTTKYIMVVPRVDMGNALIGKPCSYIGVDDVMLATDKDGGIQAVVGKRLTGRTIEVSGPNDTVQQVPEFVVVCQIHPQADYMVVSVDDVEFVNPINFVKKQMAFKKLVEKLYKEDAGSDPDGDAPRVRTMEEDPDHPGQYI